MDDAGARCAKNAGAVFSLTFHAVWCPKYRRPVLTAPVEARLTEIIREIAANRERTVHALEVVPDHLHLFVETDPRWAPAEIVGKFKAVSSRLLRQEFQPSGPACRRCGPAPTSSQRSGPFPKLRSGATARRRRASEPWRSCPTRSGSTRTGRKLRP
jgi:putative transposase